MCQKGDVKSKIKQEIQRIVIEYLGTSIGDLMDTMGLLTSNIRKYGSFKIIDYRGMNIEQKVVNTVFVRILYSCKTFQWFVYYTKPAMGNVRYPPDLSFS